MIAKINPYSSIPEWSCYWRVTQSIGCIVANDVNLLWFPQESVQQIHQKVNQNNWCTFAVQTVTHDQHAEAGARSLYAIVTQPAKNVSKHQKRTFLWNARPPNTLHHRPCTTTSSFFQRETDRDQFQIVWFCNTELPRHCDHFFQPLTSKIIIRPFSDSSHTFQAAFWIRQRSHSSKQQSNVIFRELHSFAS